jgi:hypothetical protein
LNGTVSGNTNTGVWSTNGEGVISNPSSLVTTYIPSIKERDEGATIRFILSSTNNGQCLVVRDTMYVVIRPRLQLSAGLNLTVCANNPVVNLSATVKNTSISTWSSPTGGIFSNPNSSNTTYQLSAADINNGSVTLSVTSNPGINNICSPLSSNLTVTILPAPTVNVSPNFTVCGDTVSFSLTGNSSTGSGMWVVDNASAGVFSPNNSAGNTNFVLNESFKLSGGVLNFTYTSQANGICNAVSSTTQVTVLPRPSINAGKNDTICLNGSPANLEATFLNVTSFLWEKLNGI